MIFIMNRREIFKKGSFKRHSFEIYLSQGNEMKEIVIDSTNQYPIHLPLTYFVSNKGRAKGKADLMPYESFRWINIQSRGGNAHSLVLIKSRTIKTNKHGISIFEPNGRNKYCSICILDDMKNVTRDYTCVSPEFNINYGSMTYNPGYCGVYGILFVVMFRHYVAQKNKKWLIEWNEMMTMMSKKINNNVGCLGVEIASRVQNIISNGSFSFEIIENDILKMLLDVNENEND